MLRRDNHYDGSGVQKNIQFVNTISQTKKKTLILIV